MNATDRLTVEVCWCGLEHAIPNGLSKMARENGTLVFCPLGHKWRITRTEAEKLREKLYAREAELTEARDETQRLERRVRHLEGKKRKKK